MKVPVKVIVDTETKSFEVNIGTPPVSQLIAKEVGAEKGSGVPNKEKVGNIAMEQVVKIAKMKRESMLANDLKAAVKSVVGAANSIGVLVENKNAVDINADIDEGKYDDIISNEKTEAGHEKLKALKERLNSVQDAYKAELDKIKIEQEAKAAAAGTVVGEEKKETKIEEKPAKEDIKEKEAK